MIRVKPDIVKGTQAGSTLMEVRVTRVFQVSGLPADEPERVIGMALIAVDSIDPTIRIPQRGEFHPAPEFSGCVVVDRQTESADNPSTINVYVLYRWRLLPNLYLKSVHGTLRQVDIVATYPPKGTPGFQEDIPNGIVAGGPIMLTYQRDGSATAVKYPAIFKKQLLSGTTSFKFFERQDPEFFNSYFAGAVNRLPWRGYGARTMMILPVDGSSDDNVWFSNTYTFWYRPETHDEYIFFVDANTGQVPADVAKSVRYDGSVYSGNGWTRYIYGNPLYNFNELFPLIGRNAPLSYGLISIIGQG